MGACDISFTLDGKATAEQIRKAFKNRQVEDASENGHQSGYSGDFQTVNEVKIHDVPAFENEAAAMEYCLKHAQKWDNVVAVRYKVQAPIKPDAKLKRLKERVQKLMASRNQFAEAVKPKRDALFKTLKAKPFHICRACKSRINTEYFTRAYCTVCNSDIVPASVTKRFEAFNAKIQAANDAAGEYFKTLQAKAGIKDTRWLIGGWGAC